MRTKKVKNPREHIVGLIKKAYLISWFGGAIDEEDIEEFLQIIESYEAEVLAEGGFSATFVSHKYDVVIGVCNIVDSAKASLSYLKHDYLPELTVLYVGKDYWVYEMPLLRVFIEQFEICGSKRRDRYYHILNQYSWLKLSQVNLNKLSPKLRSLFQLMLDEFGGDNIKIDFKPRNIGWTKNDVPQLFDVFIYCDV